jgi:aerobic C4-dicarboxylate transport protein
MSVEAAAVPVRRRRPIYRDLSVQILLAMALGGWVGYMWPASADSLKPLGDLFIKLIGMLVAPIVFCTVVHGIASVREAKKVGRVAVKSLIYFEIVTTLALVVALVLVNFMQPGAAMHVDPSTLSEKTVASFAESAKHFTFGEFLLDIVPKSLVGAFADGEVLQVLFVSIMFAFALSALGTKAAPVVDAIGTASQVFFKMIGYVMYLAPIGAFGAIAFTVGKFGPSTLFSLGKLVGEFYLCCALFVVLALWPIAAWAGLNLWRLIRYFGAEVLLVLGTSSGESVFPQLNAKLRKLGCDEGVVALVLPAGYAFNHTGTCLYFATVSVFLAQAVGIDLSLPQQLGLLAIMLITSKGGAGVAGSAIVMLASTLAATGTIPVAAVGLVLGVHRLLSSAFVAVNVIGNALATIIIARWEGAINLATLDFELKREVIA